MLTRLPLLAFGPFGVRSGAVIGVFALVACVQSPELDETIPDALREADYPALRPIEADLLVDVMPQQKATALAEDLEARRARLDARRRALDTEIIDAQTRARMTAGVNQ
jgi:hypothetical protein